MVAVDLKAKVTEESLVKVKWLNTVHV